MRLPPALAHLWPVAKRAHRRLTRTVGPVTRRLPVGDRAVPRRVYLTSQEAATAEPSGVRLTVTSPGEHLSRPVPPGEPAALAYWPALAEFDMSGRSVLEVDDGRLVGHYAATITAAGVLDLQTSPYWGARRWQEHPIFLNARLPEPERIAGTVVSLASHASASNYYHSLMDAVPRWGILQEAFPDLKPDAVVVGHTSSWDRQLVQLLGLDRFRLIQPEKSLSLQADRLVVPSLTNDECLGPPWTTAYLKRAFPPRDTSGKPKRLYISRGSVPNTRRLIHEAALVEELERRGFTRMDPGKFSVQDQIDHFAAAEVVVGCHGAGLTNLNFAAPGIRVLELFAADYLHPGFWSVTTNIPDATYRYLVSDGGNPDLLPPQMQAVARDITLTPEQVLAALDELLAD